MAAMAQSMRMTAEQQDSSGTKATCPWQSPSSRLAPRDDCDECLLFTEAVAAQIVMQVVCCRFQGKLMDGNGGRLLTRRGHGDVKKYVFTYTPSWKHVAIHVVSRRVSMRVLPDRPSDVVCRCDGDVN